jgi:ABC-type siderophore export system fused ATPase/permease subunit
VVPILAGAMWVVVGVVALLTFSASWRYVVGIVAIGVGLLFLRGGLTALVRQDDRRAKR